MDGKAKERGRNKRNQVLIWMNMNRKTNSTANRPEAALIFFTGNEKVRKHPDFAFLLESHLNKIEKLWGNIPVFSNVELPGVSARTGNELEILREIFSTPGEGNEDDYVVLFYNLAPFLDSNIAAQLEELHYKFVAHYTLSENVPPGFAPDLVSRSLLPFITHQKRATLREEMLTNLQDYDVELHFGLPDLRIYRLDLSGANLCSLEKSGGVHRKNPELNFDLLEEYLKNNPALVSQIPACIEVEWTSRSDLYPVWFLRDSSGEAFDLSLKSWKAFLQELSQVASCAYTMVLGGEGDPMKHPDFFQMLAATLKSDSLETLFLETFATQLDPEAFQAIEAMEGSEKITIIVRFSTLDREKYRHLYRGDRFADVKAHLDAMNSLKQEGSVHIPVYVELMRILEVEDEIDAFFKYFDATSLVPLAQKYNTRAHRLPERRVADLSPLDRTFCWHLARDLYVTGEGKIPVCRQDPLAQGQCHTVGDSLLDVIKKHGEWFACSLRGDHASIPAPCLQCDEWYTYIA